MRKTGRLEHALGSVCAAIHLQSGTGWKLWHSQTHHKNTQVGRMDPDALPYLEAVRTQPLVRAAQRMAPGYGGPLSYVELFYAFTMKNAIATLDQIFGRAHGNGRGKKTRIISETLLSTLPWIYLCARFGWPGFWLLFVLPLACANTVLMLYIYTNHHLSPRVPSNDPLINSLTVTSPRFIQWFHGDFGFHVGHQLFPSMSVRFAPQLHELLRAHYPDRYQSMPFWKAIRTLYTTGTCYTEDGERLVDLRTGEARWTLRTGRTDFAVAGHVDVTPQHAGAVARRAARHGAVEFASEERGAMPSDTGT